MLLSKDLARLELRMPLDDVPRASIDLNVPASPRDHIALTDYSRSGAGDWMELDGTDVNLVRAALFPGGALKNKLESEL